MEDDGLIKLGKRRVNEDGEEGAVQSQYGAVMQSYKPKRPIKSLP